MAEKWSAIIFIEKNYKTKVEKTEIHKKYKKTIKYISLKNKNGLRNILWFTFVEYLKTSTYTKN